MLDWWNRDDINASTPFLNISNVDECLEFHKEVIRTAAASRMDTGFSNDSGIASKRGLTKPIYIWKSEAGEPVSEQDNCKRCRLYRAVSLAAYEENCDIRNMIQGTEVSLQAKKSHVMRRASGFNELFEYLTIKEANADVDGEKAEKNHPSIFVLNQTTRPTPPIHPNISSQTSNLPTLNLRTNSGKRRAANRLHADNVREEALAALQRFQNSPDIKWTWGVDMDSSEFDQFRRAVDRGGLPPNSGYNNDLPNGPNSFSDSSTDSIGDVGFFSDLEENHQVVPDLDPAFFPPYPSNVDMTSRLPGRYLANFIDHPTIPMDNIQPSPPAPQKLVPLPKADTTLKPSGVAGANVPSYESSSGKSLSLPY